MLNDDMTILGRTVKRGESAFLELEVAKLHTRNSIKISIIVERAEKAGPTLLLMAGIHGDEVNGVAIVRDIIRRGYNKPTRGTIICIPVFNVFGYLNLTREFPDGRDLNRVFPGSAKGSLASQFAFKFTQEIAPLVDYVIDFHTGGALRENYPNVRCVFKQEKTLELAKVFDAPFIVHSNYIAKSLRITMDKMGKTILLFEGGKSNSLDPFVVDTGVKGALNVIRHLKMSTGKSKVRKGSQLIKKSSWIRAPYSGMFQFHIKNGTYVTKKTIIGTITDPYGEFEKKIKAKHDCFIFGINNAPVVHKGDALFHVSE